MGLGTICAVHDEGRDGSHFLKSKGEGLDMNEARNGGSGS
jgi:hypothetical protein